MAKAILMLQNEIQATIEGTSEEIAQVMKLYSDKEVTSNFPQSLSRTPAIIPGKSTNAIKLQVAIFLIYFVISLVVLSMAGYGVIKSLNDSMFDLYFDGLLPSIQLGAAKSALYQIQGNLDKFVLVAEVRQESEQAILDGMTDVEKNMDMFRASLLTPEEHESLIRFDSAWILYKQAIAKNMTQAKADAGQEILKDSDMVNSQKEVEAILEQLLLINHNIANILKNDAGMIFTNGVTTMIIIAVIETLMGVSFGFLYLRRWQENV